ncbi:acyltransferase [Paenibacillus sp. J5C_2022]|uniref:acyltransferase family protein n=1 Tax=Paenibacillus sp. J5C2022 TaxID=2977129 RepID=UPI0021D07832|nr:acyltransferase [Paenibacillus sp. J5C2022]MCU6710274.1 acyltransferase [Paenibacillus sp. J5C2022]
MELSKQDTRALKGMAILLMVLLHLFARKDVEGLYFAAPQWNGVPLVYYLALLGDACRPIYLFVTGYAFYVMSNRPLRESMRKNLFRILKLYVNYWVVFLLFVPLFFIVRPEQWQQIKAYMLAMDFLGLSNHVNGAWWFVQIYILMVLLSPLLLAIVKRVHYIPLLLITGALYLFSHLQRYWSIIDFGQNNVLLYVNNVGVLFGTSVFSFVVGALFAKFKVYSRIYRRLHKLPYLQIGCLFGFVILFLFHMTIESSVIAPLNAVAIICFYLLLKKGPAVRRGMAYISSHSTNIWLTHMFFYQTIFSDLTFFPKYPPLIFLWLIVLCVAASLVIKSITNPVFKWIDSKQRRAAQASVAINA